MTAGKTRWGRFSMIFGSSVALVAGALALTSMGVLALPVSISGTQFQVSADSLTAHTPASGPAFIQYGSIDLVGGSPSTGVAVTELPAGGTLPNLVQVVCAPTGLGNYLKVTLSATNADATGGLVVDATDLSGGTAVFNNIQIGVPVTSSRDGKSTFGQTADGVSITGLTQTAVYTKAGTFTLTGLHLSAALVGSC